MQNSLRSIDIEQWSNGNRVVAHDGESFRRLMRHTKEAHRQAARMVERKRRRDNYRAFYTLPDGKQVTLEQLVLFIPLDQLFRHGTTEFTIQDIRVHSLLAFRIVLSWKQVRDALYRLNHGKLLFKHIAKGVYTWKQDN